MKTNTYILKILLLLFVVTSCSKEVQEEIQDENFTVKQISDITNNYINLQTTNTANTSRVFDPTLYLTDVAAGLDDYLENGDESHAIEVGTAASVKAGASLSDDSFNQGNVIEGVVNLDNEYDYTGKYHAQILKVALIENKNITCPNGVFNYDNTLRIARAFLNSQGLHSNAQNALTESQFNNFYNSIIYRIQSNNNKLSNIVIQYKNEGILSDMESQILNAYFKAQESSDTLDSYIQYSIQIENLVTNSNIPNRSKKILLFAMATARHDINFWNPYSIIEI